MTPSLFALMGTLVSAGGGFVPKKNLRRYIIFGGVVISAIAVYWDSQVQLHFEQELRAELTGGDSFGYVNTMTASGGDQDLQMLFIHNQGNFPLYDVSLDIFDKDEFERLTKEDKALSSVEARFRASAQKTIGTIPKGLMVYIGNLPIPQNKDKKSFVIYISARNGYFTEEFTLQRVQGKWLQAIRVTQERVGKTMILHEYKDTGFPVDQLGNPSW